MSQKNTPTGQMVIALLTCGIRSYELLYFKEIYLHSKADQMVEAFDKANQLVNDEVLTSTKT